MGGNRCHYRSDGVGSRPEFMGRYVSHRHGLAGSQGSKLSRVGHSFGRSIGRKSRLVRLFHGYFSVYPRACQFDGLPWAIIVGIGLFKQVQYVFGARSRPQSQQLMMGIG